jgi:DNA-binding NarL/FixJ family response regulator
MGRTRILLADDHTMICAGFQKLLEPHYEVVGSVADGLALLKAAAKLKPDVVVLDVGMPLLNGLDAARQLKKAMPSIKLIFLTMNPDSDIATEAFRIGASAYLLKTSKPTELLQAIHNVVRGITYVTPQIKRAMEETSIRDPNARNRPRELTDRQRVVLQMLAEGRPLKEIAFLLKITHRTVRFHKAKIMEELGITTNSDLVKYAIHHGVISTI